MLHIHFSVSFYSLWSFWELQHFQNLHPYPLLRGSVRDPRRQKIWKHRPMMSKIWKERTHMATVTMVVSTRDCITGITRTATASMDTVSRVRQGVSHCFFKFAALSQYFICSIIIKLLLKYFICFIIIKWRYHKYKINHLSCKVSSKVIGNYSNDKNQYNYQGLIYYLLSYLSIPNLEPSSTIKL